jgi:hypothetical protein
MSRATLPTDSLPLRAEKETAQMNSHHLPEICLNTRAARGIVALVMALFLFAAVAGDAMGAFGARKFDVVFTAKDDTPEVLGDGTPATQAGSHPNSVTADLAVNYIGSPTSGVPDGGQIKDAVIDQIPGLVGDTTVMPHCTTAEFGERGGAFGLGALCPGSTAVGVTGVAIFAPDVYGTAPVFSLEPPPGVPARIGFVFLGVPVVADLSVNPEPPYNVVATLNNASEAKYIFGSQLTLWGIPAAAEHDQYRGNCLGLSVEIGFPRFESVGNCPVTSREEPFLTLPTNCAGPLMTSYEIASWLAPDQWVSGSVQTHDNAIPPNPVGFSGCGKLGFAPSVEAHGTTNQAETGSGLDFNLDFNDEGLQDPDGLAESTAKKAIVTLPKGMTINPSAGEGLGVCTPADLDRETLNSAPGEGCPNASKVGTLHVDLPIVEEPVEGSIFLAQQDDPTTTTPGVENPFDSLIALYFVVKNSKLGAFAKLPVKVEPDPQSGQIVVTIDDVPQLPFSHFNAHLREGARAALVSPSTCGAHELEAKLYPWSAPGNPKVLTSSFEITQGKGGGPCPPGGVPPFHPHFEAGSINNNAGSFSPFNMRLIREDGEQDMTKFSAVLPPGELGSLAGVDKCPDSAIGIARSKTGRQELASPSCPANSLIGHTLAGAGVGSALTYVGGQVYLGGPYNGDPLSVISVTPAVAGPFDAGTVVVRLALDLNPKTAEVEVDGANSDPIPHILKGIVLKLRDLRVYVDRPNFTLNPTSCDESSAKSTLFGSFLNVLDPADDKPVDLSTRYQAANCLNLGFKPKLTLNLKGGTKRGGHPGLRAIYTPKKGDANVKGLVVRLPRSAFLDQAHIKTICTRVQFAAKACPKASQYGYIKAFTPLLDTPLEGPVYLRSSNHKLPDLVFDLHGLVDIEVATRIDSKGGGIRATVENAPDAPLSKVELRMQGGKKGLIINSRNLCAHVSKANVEFTGHNGKEFSANPVMKADCGGKRKAKRHQR